MSAKFHFFKPQMPSRNEKFQTLLSQSFDDLFPRISECRDGSLEYWFSSEEQSRALKQARFLNPDQMRFILGELLFRGWQRIKDEVRRQGASRMVRNMVRDFKVPNPRVDLERYLTYRDDMGCQRLAILWVEDPMASFVHIEEAIAYFQPDYQPQSLLQNGIELRSGKQSQFQRQVLVSFEQEKISRLY